jgi:hypothetical protein
MKKGVFKKTVFIDISTLLSFKETLIKNLCILKDIGDETKLAYFFFVNSILQYQYLSLANISCKVQCLNKRKIFEYNQC